MAKTTNEFIGTGRRKTSVARVRLAPGTGKIVINHRPFETYFPLDTQRATVTQPLTVTVSPSCRKPRVEPSSRVSGS